MSLLHLPTSVNFHQDIILHIQVVDQWQVRLMHSLIRVWFLNPFRLPSSQCEAYSQHLYGLMSIFWTQKVKLFYAALLANNSH